ncbi:hypothetical protein FOA52_015800 [Chlamydomonas sp. UWO 241]|nr:hypothetical protein FOA52_015800 [Chlamydomonas sp. UWO 241]
MMALRSVSQRMHTHTMHTRTSLPKIGGSRIMSRCVSTKSAKAGDHVKVHYTGTLDDGTVFDSSRQRDPLEFEIGAGKVIKGFDIAVTGLEVGGTRKSRIAPTEAYGERDDKMMMVFPKSQAPDGIEAGVGVQLSNGMIAKVEKVTDTEVTLDLNHELAGQHLTFEVELMSCVAGDKMAKATFGAGCFWSVELAFQRTPGVISTEVGYCNGETDSPTYEQVCSGNTGHAEVVQVTYNPDEVSYDELLDVFWAKHDPTTKNRQGGDTGTQYRSGIYTHSAEQAAAAAASIKKWQAKFPAKIVTEVAEVAKYTTAEPYHQQYLAKGGRNNNPQSPAKKCTDPIRCYG